LRFENIAYNKELFEQKECQELFGVIYEKNRYKITNPNIHGILQWKNQQIDPQDLDVRNYTTILNSKLRNLIEYINRNITRYVNDVLIPLSSNIEEDENIIIGLLNNAILNLESKDKFLKTQNLEIEDINSINEVDVAKIILEQNKIKPNWSNILAYIKKLELTESDLTLSNFLSRNYNELGSLEYDLLSEEDEHKLAYLIMNNTEPDCNSYLNLISLIPAKYGDIQQINSPEHLQVLINCEQVALTVENYIHLKTISENNKDNLHVQLIRQKQDDVVKIFEDHSTENAPLLDVITPDLQVIFDLSGITSKNELKLFSDISDDIVNENIDIADQMCNAITRSDSKIKLSYSKLEIFFSHVDDINKKISILLYNFSELENEDVKNLLQLLGDKYSKTIINKGGKPTKFELIDEDNMKIHQQLFESLKQRGLISKFEVHTGMIKVMSTKGK